MLFPFIGENLQDQALTVHLPISGSLNLQEYNEDTGRLEGSFNATYVTSIKTHMTTFPDTLVIEDARFYVYWLPHEQE